MDPPRTRVLMFHNPQVFGRAQTAHLDAGILGECERLFMIAHQAPFLGDGALCYDPLGTGHAASRLTQGRTACEWVPISGLVRAQLRSFQPMLRLTGEDWVNTFDVAAWCPMREKLAEPTLVIGRHGRATGDKWPSSPDMIAASLPSDSRTQVQILGADAAFFEEQGLDVSSWSIHPFGAVPPDQFLDGLDVFSYFFSDRWVEAFGRTISEAMLMGVRCILDQRLEETFGPHAIYCAPDEVRSVLEHIRNDPATHRAATQEAQDWARATLDRSSVSPRLERLLAARAHRIGQGARSVAPTTTLRKVFGFYKRAQILRSM